MPLVTYNLAVIAAVVKELDADPARVGRVLTLSCPDLVVSDVELQALFPRVDVATLPIRADGAATLRWHKHADKLPHVRDTAALFAALGYHMDAIDRVAGRGGEMIHDLSNPLPPGHPALAAYDLVFDCISNQVFNVAQAWWTMTACCRVGGYVLSVTPVTMVNQGFWNVCPAAYADFAGANGLVAALAQHVGVYASKQTLAISRTVRARGVPDDTMTVALLRKAEHRDTPTWPVLTKFQKYPTCHLPGLPK